MVNGVILLDKPSGVTSREITEKVRQKLNAKKAGNGGILDPDSTGVLIICLDEATKAMPLLMGLYKEYIAKALFHKSVDRKKTIEVLNSFIGKVKQLPPVRSAVARKIREREIYSIDFLSSSERVFEFKIKCEAGFYVRKFIHDIGQKIGCGAHMIALRRTAVDKIDLSQCVGFDELGKKDVLSLEEVLEKIKIRKVSARQETLHDIRSGKFLTGDTVISANGDLEKDDTIGIFVDKKIAAIGKVVKTKPIYIKPDRVFN